LLQLDAAHKLSINDTVGRWLPQYPAWRRITIKQLLNMTSGIEDFATQPAFLSAYAAAPNRVFTASQLVSYVVGRPLAKGYLYSNVNYLLAQMIIERASHDSYVDQVRKRIIVPLGLHNTFVSATRYPPAVTDRLPDGYFFIAPTVLPQLASQFEKSQARYPVFGLGSGGIVSSLQDVARWDRALYTGRELPRKQQRELESLVSEKTGEPITRTTPADPAGFGLGVAQTTVSPLGTIWNYEGQTFAFRVLHVYLPRSGTDIVIGLNSCVPESKSGTLAGAILNTLRKAGLA
jgi:D-alanyl-D-alanine carboxypeptidase